MTAYLSRAAFAAAAMALGLSSAQAYTYSASGDLNVSLQINSTCTVTTTPVTFTSLGDPSDTQARGTLSVRCTSGTHYDVDLGAGGNASGGTRAMKGSKGGTVPYNLYCKSDYTGVWGSTMNNGKALAACIGQGADQVSSGSETYTVYGAIPVLQGNPTADTYNDTVLVTINY